MSADWNTQDTVSKVAGTYPSMYWVRCKVHQSISHTNMFTPIGNLRIYMIGMCLDSGKEPCSRWESIQTSIRQWQWLYCQWVHHFCPDWNISITTWCIAMNICAQTHCPQGMILLTLVIGFNLMVALEENICGFEWYAWTTIRWITRTFDSDSHVPPQDKLQQLPWSLYCAFSDIISSFFKKCIQ